MIKVEIGQVPVIKENISRQNIIPPNFVLTEILMPHDFPVLDDPQTCLASKYL